MLGVECEIGICASDCEIYRFASAELDERDSGSPTDKLYRRELRSWITILPPSINNEGATV